MSLRTPSSAHHSTSQGRCSPRPNRIQRSGGGLNLATSDELLAAVRDRGIDPVEFDPSYDDREARFRAQFASEGVPRVLYHSGAFGIEPVTYVLGETGFEAATYAAELVESVD